jgi:peroxiredoxin
MLKNGQKFPELKLQAVGGGAIDLPGDLAGSFGVVLIYRGAWCPVCNNQLADFAASKSELDALGVKVVALSVDDQATGAALVQKHNLAFPVGHSADADQTAAVIGAYTNDKPRYLQPADFILAPDGSILNAVYSSNAMGRIAPAEVKMLVSYIKAQAKAA